MLTLASNERIPLRAHMRMIFEIRDLTYATPATVSRAGILYISSVEGKQWRFLIASWVMKSDFDEDVKSQLSGLFETYVPKAVEVLSNQMKTVVECEPITAVSALLQVWYERYFQPRRYAVLRLNKVLCQSMSKNTGASLNYLISVNTSTMWNINLSIHTYQTRLRFYLLLL